MPIYLITIAYASSPRNIKILEIHYFSNSKLYKVIYHLRVLAS